MTEEKNITTIETVGEKEPSSAKLILTLAIAGFLSGVILVSTYLFTLPLIEANKAAAMQRAIFKVLPNCASFQTFKLENEQLVELKEEEKKQKKDNKEEQLVYAGYDAEKKLIGFAIPGGEPGFQDIIVGIFGYDPVAKQIIGFEVLESKETPGLGDKIFKDLNFKANFEALVVEPEIIMVKSGEKQNAHEVDAITGATISSKAVVGLLNNNLAIWKPSIERYMNEKQ